MNNLPEGAELDLDAPYNRKTKRQSYKVEVAINASTSHRIDVEVPEYSDYMTDVVKDELKDKVFERVYEKLPQGWEIDDIDIIDYDA